MIADNNDLTTLTATVADTEGNAIANTEVTFTLPEDVKANFTLSDGGKAITDAEGKAKVTLKGTKAGAHTVTASMTGGKSEQLVVNFIADVLIHLKYEKTGRTLDYSGSDGIRFGGACKPVAQISVVNQ
ncbi:Ig-like domain-containing protein [Escherichia coli]